MFFSLVRKNSRKNRKENGLFYTSLIISIISFYIILSLENQDVIIFLKTMESDAVNKLLGLIPALYVFSLFILFFLVYFSGKYQLEKRSHDLGMYIMLGMSRKKVFLMLFLEEIWSSIISLIIGIPIALFISEVISLITAKCVGLGIIEHKFSFSIWAVIWTAIGYFTIKLSALLVLSKDIFQRDIEELLHESQEKKNKKHNKVITIIGLVIAVILLGVAYTLAINGYAWHSLIAMGVTLVISVVGTFCLFSNISIVFELILNKTKKKNGLGVFTFRQLQENVFLKSNSLAVSSLLVLMAVCCFAYGVSISLNMDPSDMNTLHYTFKGDEEKIRTKLKEIESDKYMNDIFCLKMGFIQKGEDETSFKNLLDEIDKYDESNAKDMLENNLRTFKYPYLISLSGYNEILKAEKKGPLELKDNEIALYNGKEFSNKGTSDILKEVLNNNIKINLNGIEYKFVKGLYQEKLVTDRCINISYAIIVPDNMFNKVVDVQTVKYYWNTTLKDSYLKEKGLLNAIRNVNELFNDVDFEYESYLQNMGRQLFYSVAASYTSIYLAIIFLIIANTVIGVQFLMQQKKTSKRYQTIIQLGCDYKVLCKSAREQVKWYFSLTIVVAVIGSVFGVKSLFLGVINSAMAQKTDMLILYSIPIILFLCVVEFFYMMSVMRMSDKHIASLIDIKREDT